MLKKQDDRIKQARGIRRRGSSNGEVDVAYWPIATDAAMIPDVGFRGTAEVLKHHTDYVRSVVSACKLSP
jgi:hypothetical protein